MNELILCKNCCDNHQSTTTIRDNFVKLEKISKNTPLLKPWRKLISNVAIDWDDLVEHFEIANNDKTIQLLKQIENAV